MAGNDQPHGPPAGPKSHEHGPDCDHAHDHSASHSDSRSHSHSHNHSHDYSHSHGHHHHHHHHFPADGSVKNISIALATNLVFALIELVGGLWIGSMAVLADAVHDLGDSISLAVALILQKASRKQRDTRFTYGYGRLSLLSALIAGIVIVSGSAMILVESVPRLWNPAPAPDGFGMMALALLGISINGFAAFRLSRGESQNEKVLTWHLLEDLFGWVAVLVGAILIKLTGWPLIDPLLAVGLSLFIMWNAARNLWQTLELFLQRAPLQFDSDRFRARVQQIPGVKDLHDLHAWSVDGSHNILSLHLILLQGTTSLLQMQQIKTNVRSLAREFGRYHITIEVEIEDDPCIDDCEQ